MKIFKQNWHKKNKNNNNNKTHNRCHSKNNQQICQKVSEHFIL